MSSPYGRLPAGPYPPPSGFPRAPEPRRPLRGGVFTVLGLAAGTAFLVGLVLWLILRAFAATLQWFTNTVSDVQGTQTQHVSTAGAAGLAVVVALVVFGIVFVAGSATLGLLRLGDGYARMPVFVLGLLAWLLGLVPSAALVVLLVAL